MKKTYVLTRPLHRNKAARSLNHHTSLWPALANFAASNTCVLLTHRSSGIFKVHLNTKILPTPLPGTLIVTDLTLTHDIDVPAHLLRHRPTSHACRLF